MNSAKWLVFVLRANGVAMLLALPAVFMPLEWMAKAHDELGLGVFPDAVIVQYLARTISGLYVVLGLMTLKMSLNIMLYLSLIRFWAAVNLVAGVVLLGIDVWLQMPLFWIVIQGPYVILYSTALLVFERQLRRETVRS